MYHSAPRTRLWFQSLGCALPSDTADRLCLILSSLAPAHDGRQVGTQPGLSSSSGLSQHEGCRTQASVWRIPPQRTWLWGGLAGSLCPLPAMAHWQSLPLFIGWEGFWGHPRYVYTTRSLMEGRTQRWFNQKGKSHPGKTTASRSRGRRPQASLDGEPELQEVAVEAPVITL